MKGHKPSQLNLEQCFLHKREQAYLVTTDVNRTIQVLQKKLSGPGWGGQRVSGGQEGEGGGKPRTLTEVAGLCSVQKNWLMNKN